MAKFCTNCGNSLEEGTMCNCQEPQKEILVQPQEGGEVEEEISAQLQEDDGVEEEISAQLQEDGGVEEEISAQLQESDGIQEEIPVQSQKSGEPQEENHSKKQIEQEKNKYIEYLSELFQLIKKILKQPSVGLPQYTLEGNHQTALGLIGLQAILSALFVTAIFGSFNSMLRKSIGEFIDEYPKFPLFKDFILTILISLLLTCALAGILYVLVKVFKGNTTYKQMLCVVSGRSIAVIPGMILAIIMFYISPGIAFFLFFAGNILGILFVLIGLKSVVNMDENLLIYVVFLSFVAFLIVNSLVVRATSTWYVPKEWQSSVLSLLSGLSNPANIFKSLY